MDTRSSTPSEPEETAGKSAEDAFGDLVEQAESLLRRPAKDAAARADVQASVAALTRREPLTDEQKQDPGARMEAWGAAMVGVLAGDRRAVDALAEVEKLSGLEPGRSVTVYDSQVRNAAAVQPAYEPTTRELAVATFRVIASEVADSESSASPPPAVTDASKRPKPRGGAKRVA